jgi:hypothetical protein
MSAPLLTQAIIQALLHYEPLTGEFTWKHRSTGRPQWNARYAGKSAGYDWSPDGTVTYRSIRIFDWPFLAHRLAWLYKTGRWPRTGVDHRDLNGLNNAWSNLREATKSQNGANTRAHRTNTSGYKGVSYCRSAKRYRATIKVGGKQKWLGYFDDPAEAHEAYIRAAIERSGEFARAS